MLRASCNRAPSSATRVSAWSPRRRITRTPSLPTLSHARSSLPSFAARISIRLPSPPRRPGLRRSIPEMAREYEEMLNCLSSLITQRPRGHGGNRTDRLPLTFDHLKMLELEEEVARLKIIHVAGTKGKGSTCTFTESILRSCGFRTGLFTSPHLIDIRERFRLDGVEVSEEKFLEHFWWCWNRLKEKTNDDVPMPTLFRFLALLAFKIFSAGQVDVAILEVGLGGKFDATNVVKEPIVCGITSLGYDHMNVLGNSLGEIAAHKAGIFKKGIPAFTVTQPEEAMHILEEKASQLDVPLQVVSPIDPGLLKTQYLGLDGEHQCVNAALAIALSTYWLKATGNLKDMSIDQNNLPEEFIGGLSRAKLEGRAQIVPFSVGQQQNSNLGGLTFYLDGAHSPESMEVCAKWFSRVTKEDGLHLRRPHENNRTTQVGFPCSLGGKEHLQILLFNCKPVRDPELLLPRLVNTCAQNGVRFHKALFVPNQSVYHKVGSHVPPPADDVQEVDLSWQLSMQKTWENLVHSEQGYAGVYDGSLVFPSLPLAIKWLRESVQRSRSTQFQVLVTGSLHLVGDVLRLIRK